MKKNKIFILLIGVFIVAYCLMLFWRGIRDAVAFAQSDKINLLLYGVEPVVLSLGLTDNVNYRGSFDNSVQTYAPGGYGMYAIGSLGKLSQLEEDPDMLRRTFSLMMSARIDYYLYPKNSKVYHSSDFTSGFAPTKSAIIKALFSPGIASNARFLDKLYLFFVIVKQRKIDYVDLKTDFVSMEGRDKNFDSDDFFREYQGFFYKKSLRDNNTSVKIVYNEYFSAGLNLARVLNGEGVRVSDIVQDDIKSPYCLIRFENQITRKKHADTETAIRALLKEHCVTKEGIVSGKASSDGFDMVLILSPKTEDRWR